MKRDDVIRMAQECNLIGMRPHLDGIYQESIERFAALVAAAAKAEEREACAKVCEGRIGGAVQTNEWWNGFKAAMKQCAAAIRARGLT